MMTQIKFQGTEEQFAALTRQCEMSEALLANTLSQRIAGMSAEENINFILSWFSSVRHMSQAAYMTSGIRVQVNEETVLEPSKSVTFKLMDAVIPYLEKELKLTLSDAQKESIYIRMVQALG